MYKIALEYSEKTNKALNPDELYYFFIDVCKAEKIKPNELKPHIKGNWLNVGKTSSISIKPIHFKESILKSWIDQENAIDFEEMILSRQEKTFD